MHYKPFWGIAFIYLSLICIASPGAMGNTLYQPSDSIGVEKRNGKSFILHKVSPQETLYAISRKYHVTVEKIAENNPDVEATDISVGDTLLIPFEQSYYQNSRATHSGNKHEVKEQETLYSIATRYNVSVDQLMEWNNLNTTNIAVGQKLTVKPSQSGPNKNTPSSATVMHEVKPEETLYSISKKYGVTVRKIMDWNNLESQNIFIGQGLEIHKSGNKTAPKTETKKVAKNKEKTKNTEIHKVKAKETLYSLAVKYNIQVEEIMDWNNLDSEVLKPGQRLIVDSSAAPKKNLTSGKNNPKKDQQEKTGRDSQQPENQEKENNDPFLTANKNEKNNYNSLEARKERFMEQKKQDETERKSYKRVNKTGLAEKIEGTADTEKFLALHRTAPIGTIMEVENEMNNLSLFVRVIGRLPDTGENEKILIKISQKAFEGLEAVNNRFPVNISYIP